MGQIPRSTEHIFSLLFKIIIFYEYFDVVSHVTEQMCHYVLCGRKKHLSALHVQYCHMVQHK